MNDLLVFQCSRIGSFICFCMCVSSLLYVSSPSFGTISLDLYVFFQGMMTIDVDCDRTSAI